MNKEQAIKIINDLIQNGFTNFGGSEPLSAEETDAFEIAIKALEQDLCEDCVSRKFMYELGATCIATRDKNGKLIALGSIKNLPPVTPTHYIAEVRFSKEDLREICNERIEIECTHETCKDCTNYVVGALDEEICLRGHELIRKDFYCADFEKRGSEE